VECQILERRVLLTAMTPADSLLMDAAWGNLQAEHFRLQALSASPGIIDAESHDVRGLWSQTIAEYLSDDLWIERDRYDASHVLMVPMEAAFQLGVAEWQQQFADHFDRAAAYDHDQTTDNIGKLQYFYLASRFAHLAAAAQKWEMVGSEWLTRLYAEVERWWNVQEVGNWGTRTFSGGIRERVLWKLNHKQVDVSYHRAITDFELHLIAIAAELRAFERLSDTPTVQTPLLEDVLTIGKRIFTEEGVWQADGGWMFQPGVYADHSTYQYAGHTTMVPGMLPNPVAGIGEDTAHSIRYPLWLTSLADASEPDSADRSFYQRVRHGFATQFVNHVLVPPSDAIPVYRLTNYMDGHNGVYRWNYSTTGMDRGQGPYALSRSLLNGWFVFTQHPDVRSAYSQLAAQYPLSDAELDVYIPEVYSDRTFHPLVSVPQFYHNGMSELIVKLASRMTGWRPVLQAPLNRQLPRSGAAVQIDLDAWDVDSHAISFSAHAQSIEYYLDQRFGFVSGDNLHFNWGGADEKWIRSSASQWFFIRPNGELVKWTGPGLTGQRIATLSSSVYDNPVRLHAAQPNEAAVEVEITATGAVSLQAREGELGTAAIVVQASDERHRTSQLFVAEVTSNRPVLDNIGHQVVQANRGQLELRLGSSGPNRSEHRYVVTAESLESYLVNRLQLVSGVGSHFNWGGREEKWFLGAGGQWYFLLPNGELFHWDEQRTASGKLLATLTSQHYDRPESLISANVESPVHEARVDDGLLRVAWTAEFRGSFVLHVSVDDGHALDSESIFVSVNQPPEWSLLGDATLTDARDRLAIPFTVYDPDAQFVRLASTVHSLEYYLDQSLGLFTTGDDHTNWGGRSEKWLMGEGHQWYFILPDGRLYAWDGGRTASGTLVDSVSESCYVEPHLLHEARPDPAPAQVSRLGEELVIRADPEFSGTCLIDLTATDGLDQITQTVRLYVNQAPLLEPLGDQTWQLTDGVMPLRLRGRDPEGAALEYSADALNLAWVLDHELDFVSDGRVSENYGGLGEKWILDSRRRWHFITPDGSLYRWDSLSDSASGTLIGRVGSRVHDDLRLLYAPSEQRAAVDITVVDDVLLLDLTGMSREDFLLDVAVGDGLAWDRQRVRVAVM